MRGSFSRIRFDKEKIIASSAFPHSTRYRADIEGLRAVAILPVLLFHYAVPPFTGGFVGVDVFFVISGFIITTTILADLRDATFSIQAFYERRIRRILPALCAVFLVCAVVALVLFTPKELVRIGSEFSWSFLFSTNFLFFRKDGYFEGASTMRVLLHTWSLSVEEQFYLAIPLLLSWGYRSFKARLPFVLLGLLVLSFAFSSVWVFRGPSAAFYLLPSRAWELLTGCVLAFGIVPSAASPLLRDAAAWSGAALIGTAVFAFTNATPFPGLAATLPCLGAALIIWSSQTGPSAVGRILSARPFVDIGKISFSLYLWHWPLLVMAKYYLLREPTSWEGAGLIAVSFALAISSYVYIEQPFRRKTVFAERKRLFVLAAGSMLVIGLFGRAAELTHGFPIRLSPKALTYAAMYGNRDPRHDACMALTPEQVLNGGGCSYGTPHDGPPDFAVWGDSHMGALMPLIDDEAKKHGLWGIHYGKASCPPLLGVNIERADAQRADLNCREFNDAVGTELTTRSIGTVFLIARWSLYSEGWPKIGIDARNKPIFTYDAFTPKLSAKENRGAFQRGLARTVAFLDQRNIHAYAMEPIPEALVDVPNAMATNTLLGRPISALAPKRDQVEARQSWVGDQFKAVNDPSHFTFIPTHDRLCDLSVCKIALDDVVLYRDNDHLSMPGARYLEPVFDPVFERMERRP